MIRRRSGVPDAVLAAAGLPRGEKVLASTEARDGTWLLGTRDALVVVDPAGAAVRLPWERVDHADWDADDERLRVAEVGGPPRAYALDEPALLLQLLRERVTASVVLQRRVPVDGKRGVSVVARRPPAGGAVTFTWAAGRGLDPDDPGVVAAAEQAVAAVRAELGL